MGRIWDMGDVRARRDVLLGMLGCLLAGEAAAGQVPVGSPDLVVKQLAGQALAALTATVGHPQRRREAMDRLLGQGFDLELIAQLVLGKYGRVASPAELEEYRRLFRAFVQETYGSRLDKYGNQQLRVVGVQPAGQDAMVESHVEGLAGGATARLDWRLRNADNGWKVIDLVIEGVSMVVTQRNEFATIIERGGGRVSALLTDLRQRVKVAASE